ncbi:WxL domain-containing protein [Lacticaseibacillus nasuensis]|uniref:WxL domain-containing protein n=1 Tax=Lacticaseibacillus nasuensis TaxID=944671 RepID=UPI00224771D7|nr:WxL domain-containing protein [Lacticaseibacillus nasuensis]MCX2455294.1 WxL domain-containing protein [Lacticaseibacillus nasuensis]
MKKTLIASAAALALAAAAAIAPAAVSADDTTTGPATDQTTAEFTVSPGGTKDPGGDHGTGDNANLWLVKTPDLLFSNATVGEIISNNTTLKYLGGKVSETHRTGDPSENQDGALQISDLRGTGAGWTLTASVNQPSLGDSKLDGTLTLAFKDAKSDFVGTTNDDGTPDLPATAAPQTATLSTSGTTATVWTAAAKSGQGANTATVDPDKTTFEIFANPGVTAGTYDATVTWTLGSTVTPN